MTGRWSVAVFTSREDGGQLQRTLAAVIAAVAAAPCTIDVLVDGNAATAAAMADWTPRPALAAGSTMRLWLVPWGDKACTWNRYLHEIAPDASIAFFVDGYVRPAPDSLAALARALDADPEAWAAGGVPSVGRSAAALRQRLIADGGLHGNLYALRGSFVALLRQRDFRLPLGLYRNDSLIGAVASFGADPARCAWDRRRIAVVTDASWDNDLPSFGPALLRSWFKRRMRQAQGDLENAAVRRHLETRRLPPEHLPRTTTALLHGDPEPAPLIARRGMLDRWLMRRAAGRLAVEPDWSRATLAPRLLKTWPDR